MEIAPVLPTRSQAEEFAWSSAAARHRLVHGFDSRNASSRSFNLIRSKLVALQRERGWRSLGIVSATRTCTFDAKVSAIASAKFRRNFVY